MRSLKPLIAACAALALILIPAAGASAAPAAGKTDKVLKIAARGTVDSLNPFIAIYDGALDILSVEYEPLTGWGPKNTDIPLLASKWSTAADGKTWTYTIRPGLKWSDGKPLTADDAAWTYEAIMKNADLASANGALVANVASVKAVDEHTFQLVTKTVQSSDPATGLPIVPEHIWSKQSDPAKFANDSNVVGSGPYVLTTYKRSQSSILVANPNYWGGKPALDGIDFISYKDVNAAVEAVKSGEVDVATDLTPAQYDSLKSTKGVTVNEGQLNHYWSLNVNPGALDVNNKPMGDGNAVLQDQVVRQAIQQAIDQDTLVKKVLGGHGATGPTIIPPAFQDYYYDDKSVVRPFSIDAANKSLDAAGYKKNADGIRLDKSGNPITLRLAWDSGRVMQQQAVTYLEPWFEQLGFKITPVPESASQLAQDLTLGKYDILFDGWGVSPDPDYMLYINTCASRPNADGSGNTSAYNWCNTDFDALYNAQHIELNQDQREADVKKALGILYNAAVVDVVFYDAILEAHRSDAFSIPVKEVGTSYGKWAFTDAKPAATNAESTAPDYTGEIIAGIVVVVLVIIVVIFLIRRRRSREERE